MSRWHRPFLEMPGVLLQSHTEEPAPRPGGVARLPARLQVGPLVNHGHRMVCYLSIELGYDIINSVQFLVIN